MKSSKKQFLKYFEFIYTEVGPDMIKGTLYFQPPMHFQAVKIGEVNLAPDQLSKTFVIDRMEGIGLLTGYRFSVTISLNLKMSLIQISISGEAMVLSKHVLGSPWNTTISFRYSWPRPVSRKIGKADIAHVVVVMMENRSFDNLVGWLYDKTNRPALNIPSKKPPTYNGLQKHKYWNPKIPKYINNPHTPENERVYATEGASNMTVPTTDPHEQFRYMNYQIFGKKVPGPKDPETMDGFVVDFADALKESGQKTEPAQIMECYSTQQVSVLTELAKNYAICDRWFASAPCQTWPNRGFVHAGTSCGRVNNLNKSVDDNTPPDPFYYDTRTVFNAMYDLGVSWKVYGDSVLPTLTRYQFITQLWNPLLDGHFRSFNDFKKDAKADQLPAYSFIEPDFMIKRNDYHPPHDVTAGEKFLYDVWTVISTSPAWEKTLLVITFDEHGGCYDHVTPPENAIKPDNSPPQKMNFQFNRYGVRVPTILVSPFIEAGTVFRTGPGKKEYDHTSILATLRDWQQLDRNKNKYWLKSKRIANAPLLNSVLTRTKARTGLPNIPKPSRGRAKVSTDIGLNAVQTGVLAALLMGPVPSRKRYQDVVKQISKIKSVGKALEVINKLT